MQNLPWHIDPGLSVVEALSKWCAALLAEKAEAVRMLEDAKAVKAKLDEEIAGFASHRSSVEAQVQANAQIKSRLDQRELSLNAKEANLVSRETDVEKRDAALVSKQARHANDMQASAASLDARQKELDQREHNLVQAERKLAADQAAHEKRVRRVREAVA